MAGNQMAVATSNSSGQFVELRFLSQANPDKAQSKEWMWQSLEAGRPWEEFTSISVHNGAYASFLELVSAEIDKALAVLRVDAPLRPSLELFAESLRDGDLSKHVESGKAWVRAPDLTVDTYMGFTENYRDPLKLQLEYQGMVFIRDPVSSPMFRKLSEMSAELLSRLPWSNDFEQELPWTTDDSSETNQTNRTKAKSFGSVMAAAFVSYYVPRGANLPNYESVKRVGGKNFNIVNSVMAKANLTRVAFLSPEDADLLERRYVDAFNIKLALHEQLGHDSGILLRKNKQGQANFNESLIDPTTGDKVAQWYTVGQSYYSKFGNIAAAFEETRANAIALYLACDKDVLTIFGHNSTDADEVCAAVFLNQIFTGLTALKSYDLETGWQSDHRQSDFALMRVLMEVLPDFVKIHEENENIRLTIDRSQIPEQTTAAVRDFVLHLQVYRATGNAIEGRKLFESYLAIDAYWLRLRAKVVNSEAEIPEPSFVQGNILRDPDVNPSDGSPFTWKDYPASCQGVLASLRDRFDADQIKAIESAVEKEVGA